MNITDLPFNQLMGIVHSEREGHVLSLPGDNRYTNHLGTVHASALLALAEATSGWCLIEMLAGTEFETVPVVRRIEARFRKSAFGAIHSRFNVASDKKTELVSTLNSRGRALIKIAVDVYDERGGHSLAAVVEWFLARKK